MHIRFASALVGATLLTFAASTASAQSPSDFFDQKSEWFANETVEGASKHAEAPTQTPATVTVIGREEIELYGFKTVADVLNFASIGYFTQNDRRYDIAGGRGLFFFEDYNTRILVMLNGHPLNEPWNNFAGLGREMLVPFDLVERVEIVYGPSSLLYGGYSLLGIVNVVTRNGGTLSGTRLRAEAGSWSTIDVAATWGASGALPQKHGRPAETWDILVSGGRYRSDGEDLTLPLIPVDYATGIDGRMEYGGPQSGTDFERSPYAFLQARRGELSITARTGSRRKGAPLAPYQALYGSRQDVRDEKSFVELRWDHTLAQGVRFSARAFHDRYEYLENDPYFEEEIGRYDFVLEGSDRDTGAELRFTAQRGTHYLTAGAEYRTRSVIQKSFTGGSACACSPSDVLRDEIDGNLTVVYLQEEWRPTNRWTLVAGGNWADTEPGGQKAMPRLAAIFHARDDVAVKALYGRGFRPPSIYEASYKDYIDLIPNPEIASEEITSREISVMWNRRGFAVQAYVFDSDLEGLIRATEIGSIDDVEGGVLPPSGDPDELLGLLQYQSAGDVASRGFGIGARTRHRAMRAYVNVARAEATFTSPDGESFDLPASANWLASGGAAWDAGDWAASLSARYVGTQPHDPARELDQRTGSFFEANGRLLWRTRAVYPLTIYVDVKNLFDDQGTTPAGTIYTPPEIPIEGRRILVGGELRF